MPQIDGNFSCENNLISTLEGCSMLFEEYNFSGNRLPDIVMEQLLIKNNHDMINLFLKFQEHYYVWENGFNKQGFDDLMIDLKEGLR